jgi:hypothetical protein
MTQVLRGQQGFPTGDERPPAGPAGRDIVERLPGEADWRHAEQAEAAVEDVRAVLAQHHGAGEPAAGEDSAELVREAEQIEDEVAPGRGTEGDEPPSETSTHD